MKKFSKLITESKKELWTKHPLVNTVDWEEIFKPLIEHIDSNLKANVPPPGEGIFGSNTKVALDELIDAITEDYSEYFQNVVDDGSQESFFNAYSINTNHQDVLDCLQPLSDRTSEVEDFAEWDWGCYIVDFRKIKYKDLEELIEDIEDIHLKLKMLKVNYTIRINSISKTIDILESSTNIESLIKSNWVDSWGRPSTDIGLFNNANNSSIKVFIFNRETVQAADLG
jgi:hypothetical protein